MTGESSQGNWQSRELDLTGVDQLALLGTTQATSGRSRNSTTWATLCTVSLKLSPTSTDSPLRETFVVSMKYVVSDSMRRARFWP